MTQYTLIAVTTVVFCALIFGMVLIVRSAKRNRSAGGIALAAVMLMTAGWMQPPPRLHDIENEAPRRKTGGDRDNPPEP